MVAHSVVHFANAGHNGSKNELAGKLKNVNVFDQRKLVPFESKSPDAILFSQGYDSVLV